MYIEKQRGFDQFTCIAEKCPESCCKFWQILVDEDSLKCYQSLSEHDERIQKNVNFQDGCFSQNGRICGFLDPEGLCYLQKTYGEEMLCGTCRNYPRHMEEFENVREFSLSLSCPHAAEMLIDDPSLMKFDSFEDETEEEYEDFDYLLYDKLLDTREFLFQTAQDRSLSLSERMDRIMIAGHIFQKLLDEDRLFEMDDAIDRLSDTKDHPDDIDHGSIEPDENRAFSVLYELEHLHEDWLDTLDHAWKNYYKRKEEKDVFTRFSSFIKEYETAGEQILMLFLYTYYCGAVYDGWIFSKVCLSVYSVKWIFSLAFSGGATKSALVKAAYQYAREIEHSDQNLDLLEEWFMDQTGPK